ncbi:MAG TPA: cytochrome c oxidase subunit II [Vicinamibacterales bacterium]|nr:cytochrome c oxidase subunit II [Vicinamibacterales bacterium]
MPHLQSILHPAGIQAQRISELWWTMFWICTAVWFAVAIAASIAIVRGRRAAAADTSQSTITRNVAIAGGVSLVALFALLFQSVVIGRALDTLRSPDALRIQVTGNQWWWDVQYDHPVPSLRVTTANEIHIPTGRPVVFNLLSTDVIHSLWIPNLQGKIDLIPGRLNELWLQADTAGVYRGQCAEYCGLQHARMALVVVAEPPEQFERWLTANRAPAPPPVSPEQQRGRDIVERGPCAMCHNITGTLAGGRTAPDLTHIATRSTIAAGSVPNLRGYLAGWIADPQSMKPGNRMPPQGLRAEELQAVLAYLETLK